MPVPGAIPAHPEDPHTRRWKRVCAAPRSGIAARSLCQKWRYRCNCWRNYRVRPVVFFRLFRHRFRIPLFPGHILRHLIPPGWAGCVPPPGRSGSDRPLPPWSGSASGSGSADGWRAGTLRSPGVPGRFPAESTGPAVCTKDPLSVLCPKGKDSRHRRTPFFHRFRRKISSRLL